MCAAYGIYSTALFCIRMNVTQPLVSFLQVAMNHTAKCVLWEPTFVVNPVTRRNELSDIIIDERMLYECLYCSRTRLICVYCYKPQLDAIPHASKCEKTYATLRSYGKKKNYYFRGCHDKQFHHSVYNKMWLEKKKLDLWK